MKLLIKKWIKWEVDRFRVLFMILYLILSGMIVTYQLSTEGIRSKINKFIRKITSPF